MISSEADESQQANLIDRLMSLPNQIWDETIQAIKVNPEALKDVECLKQFVNVLRTNHRACISLGNVYVHQVIKRGVEWCEFSGINTTINNKNTF